IAGDVHAVHLGPVLRVLEHLFGRNLAGAHDVLVVVDVVNESVERRDTLAQSLLQLAPLGGGNDARGDVERDEAFRAGVVAVDRKGDPDAAENQISLGALVAKQFAALFRQPPAVVAVAETNAAIGSMHLVEHLGSQHDVAGANRSEASVAMSTPERTNSVF